MGTSHEFEGGPFARGLHLGCEATEIGNCYSRCDEVCLKMQTALDRRAFLRIAGSSLPALAFGSFGADETPLPRKPKAKTEFQIACMTLPYAQFPLERALT